jgi:hypothetical protein
MVSSYAGDIMRRTISIKALTAFLAISATGLSAEQAAEPAHPTGVIFHRETIFRSDGIGDGWCQTWAADDSVITSVNDGNWLAVLRPFNYSQYDWSAANPTGPFFHNKVYRILGKADPFERQAIQAYPQFSGKSSWFGFGLLSVDRVLYSAISKTPGSDWSTPMRGIKLLRSDDNGKSWQRINQHGKARALGEDDPARDEVRPEEMFFLEESGLAHKTERGYPFSWIDFVQRGRDNSEATDRYVYIYSPEGAHSNRLLLARVEKDKLGIRAQWRFFVRYDDKGEPVWSSDLTKRGYVQVFPEKSQDGNYFGWTSWLPSVVWNKGLKLYIMVNGGTYAGKGMTDSDEDYYDSWPHSRTGSLGFWYSVTPYGPWHQIYYTDYWIADDPGNRIYWPKLSPKWISADGRDMTLIWSDAMEDAKGRSWGVNYRWNQMRISLSMGDKLAGIPGNAECRPSDRQFHEVALAGSLAACR